MNKQMEATAKRSIELTHRSDIDGLRAVAVLAVLAYHYWGAFFGGGFIGVDVFFVISGYLLSAIIISEAQADQFSFFRFYERRIRRIFPALFALLAVSSGFAVLFLLPPDLVSFCHSMLAASLSGSNLYFWRTSNYFDGPAAVKPLLHTWSLGVEEQFYIVLPIFIVLIQRYLPRYLRRIVTAVAISSFIWSIVEVRRDPAAAFFMPFSRSWELLLGTALALQIIPAPRSQMLREVLAAFGVLGIVCSIFLLSANTPFPGENALLPSAAAAAIILAGNEGSTLASRLLSRKPLVFIGLISYSLYLWHWPLLVFSKIAVSEKFDFSASASHLLLAVLSIAIATMSWRFVETPFRSGNRRPSMRMIFIFGLTCVATTVVSALILSSRHGQMGRFPHSVDEISDYLDYAKTHPDEFRLIFGSGSCYLDRREAVAHYNEQGCLKPTPGKQQVLIFGDSHAANLRPGLESAFPNVKFLQATSSSCPPTLAQNRSSTPECKQFVSKVLNEFIPAKSISMVLLDAFWSQSDLANLTDTVALLQRRGVRVVVFGPFPVYDSNLPRLLAQSITSRDSHYAAKHLVSQEETLDEQMSRMAHEKWHVPYVSPLKTLCPGNTCIEYVASGVPLEFDTSHLTLQGSRYLGQSASIGFPHLFESK
jgi:peptidoglycan/LPS O-acetylase OafA/YrhL